MEFVFSVFPEIMAFSAATISMFLCCEDSQETPTMTRLTNTLSVWFLVWVGFRFIMGT